MEQITEQELKKSSLEQAMEMKINYDKEMEELLPEGYGYPPFYIKKMTDLFIKAIKELEEKNENNMNKNLTNKNKVL